MQVILRKQKKIWTHWWFKKAQIFLFNKLFNWRCRGG